MSPAVSVQSDSDGSRSRFRRRCLLGSLSVLVLTAFLLVPVAHTFSYSCAACGKHRTDLLAFGMPLSRTESETDCSRWYRNNLEPHHDHLWVRNPWSQNYYLWGTLPGFGNQSSNLADGPLAFVGTGMRLLIYQESDDPKKVRDIFIRLAKWESGSPQQRAEQEALFRQLNDWQNNGSGDPWPETPQ